jgi:hypothetical protein
MRNSLSTSTVLRRATAALAALLTALHASADVHEVHPGDDWSRLADRIKPGDEIVLAEGEHVPATFTGLRGEPTRPIVIRPALAGKLAEIRPDREALKLVDCSHVRVERILVRNARRAGILVESSVPGASRDIGLADVLVIGVKGLAEQAGVVIRESSEVGILRSRFENCAGSGILIENSDGVTVDSIQIIARKNAPMQAGVAIAGACERPSVLRVSVSGQVDTAFEIGRKAPERLAVGSAPPASAPADAPSTKRAAVRNLVITESRSRGSARAIDFGSCEECVVRSSTFLDSREEVHRVAPPPTGYSTGSLRFTDNLVAWEPGVLRRLASIEPGGEAARFVFGPNLWWSSELPVALPRIGVEGTIFTGTIDAAQILDVDPVLDNYGYSTSERSRGFGAPKP